MAELSPASAGDAVARLLAAAGPILSLDIGSGTQDVLLALPGERAENWPRFVLPSPALGIADRIREFDVSSATVEQPPVAPSGCTGTTWAAVSPSPFRNKRQPGSPPPLLLMRPSPCTTIPSA